MDSWLTPDIEAYRKALSSKGVNVPAVYNPQDSYGLSRNVDSLYAMANLRGDLGPVPFRANVGARYESTKQTVNSNLTDGCDCDIQNVLGKISTTTKYDDILPSANVVFDLTDSLILRLAAAKTLVRPILDNSSKLSTSQYEAKDSAGQTTVFVDQGSPTLKPLTAKNLDVSLEWYYGQGAGLSFGAFAKDVKNGTFTALVCPTSWNSVSLTRERLDQRLRWDQRQDLRHHRHPERSLGGQAARLRGQLAAVAGRLAADQRLRDHRQLYLCRPEVLQHGLLAAQPVAQVGERDRLLGEPTRSAPAFRPTTAALTNRTASTASSREKATPSSRACRSISRPAII
ncbi:TonB-dependent receptor domain-containing protein [Caulobacter segnis]